MAKPDLIKWVSGDEAAKITDPGATKKLSGFIYKEKPPFQYLNWFFNQIYKWFRGLQGNYFDVVVGSATQVTNLEATHVLSDLDDTLVTAGTKVLILDGTHTLLANFALANDSIKIIGESVSAIIDVSTFTFTLSGNNVDAELKIINSGVDDVVISGIGSFFRGVDLDILNISVSKGSKAITTGLLGGEKPFDIVYESIYSITLDEFILFSDIPEKFQKIIIFLNEVTLDSTNGIQMLVGTSGGLITTVIYRSNSIRIYPAIAQANASNKFMISAPVTTSAVYNGVIELTLYDKTTNKWILSGAINGDDETDSVDIIVGSITIPGVLTQIEMRSFISGNFNGGEMRIAYE